MIMLPDVAPALTGIFSCPWSATIVGVPVVIAPIVVTLMSEAVVFVICSGDTSIVSVSFAVLLCRSVSSIIPSVSVCPVEMTDFGIEILSNIPCAFALRGSHIVTAVNRNSSRHENRDDIEYLTTFLKQAGECP